jgi:hypothetical protein
LEDIVKKKCWTGGLIAMLVLFVQLPAFAQTKEDLQSLYVNHLRAEGYLPEIDSDGDIEFKVSGYTHYIIVNENDPGFFRMYRLITLSTQEHRQKSIPAAQYASGRTKTAKVYILESGNTACIATEIFVSKPEGYQEVFPRLLAAITYARTQFLSQL